MVFFEDEDADEPKRAPRKGMEGMDLRVVVWMGCGRAWNVAGRDERFVRVSRMRKSRERMRGELWVRWVRSLLGVYMFKMLVSVRVLESWYCMKYSGMLVTNHCNRADGGRSGCRLESAILMR
jgi:hypothetical protein